jgi:excisionase family DNA binding protein
MATNTEFLKVNEAAAMLNVSPGTIWAAIYRGDLRAVRIGRAVRIASDVLSEYINRPIKGDN